MTEEIMALCKAMGATDDQEELLLPLVRAAEESLTARLRVGISPVDCGSAFPLAAAMVAMEGLEGAAGISGVTSFTAGEVSIRTGAAPPPGPPRRSGCWPPGWGRRASPFGGCGDDGPGVAGHSGPIRPGDRRL